MMIGLTLAELDSFRTCDRYREVRARLCAISSDPHHAFTAVEARSAGCGLFDVLWAAARVAQEDSHAQARLTGFVLDLVARSVPLVASAGGSTDGLRSLVEGEATAEATRRIERSEKAKEAQQEFAELFAPEMIVADAFWATEETGSWRSLYHSLDRAWADWALWASWMIEAARAIHIEATIAARATLTEGEDELVQQGAAATDLAFLDYLVRWLSRDPPARAHIPAPVFDRKREFDPALVAWNEGRLEWHHVAVLWRRAESIGSLLVGRNARLVIPSSVRRIDLLDFYEGGEIIVEEGCKFIGHVDISHGGSLLLPESIIAINSVRIHIGGRIEGFSPRYIGELELYSYHDGIAPGARYLGSVTATDTKLGLPSTVIEIGELIVADYNEEGPLDLPEQLGYLGRADLSGPLELTLPASLTESGPIHLHNGCELFVPRSISTRVEIDRGDDCRVTLTGGDGQSA